MRDYPSLVSTPHVPPASQTSLYMSQQLLTTMCLCMTSMEHRQGSPGNPLCSLTPARPYMHHVHPSCPCLGSFAIFVKRCSLTTLGQAPLCKRASCMDARLGFPWAQALLCHRRDPSHISIQITQWLLTSAEVAHVTKQRLLSTLKVAHMTSHGVSHRRTHWPVAPPNSCSCTCDTQRLL